MNVLLHFRTSNLSTSSFYCKRFSGRHGYTQVLVAVSCIASYKLFRRNILNSSEQLTWKMLLLPTLMTLLLTAITLRTSVLLVGLNNGYAITISQVLTLQLCTSRTLH